MGTTWLTPLQPEREITQRDWAGHITELEHSKVIAHSQQARGSPATSASHSAHKGLSAPHCIQLQSTQLAMRLCWACAGPFDPSATHMRWASTPPPQGRPRRVGPAGRRLARALPAHSVLTLSAWGECRLPDPFASRRRRTALPRPARRAGGGARVLRTPPCAQFARVAPASSVGRAEPRRHCGGGGRSVCP